MIIRRAEKKDILGLQKLLHQVLIIHYEARPDIFKNNETKYTNEELEEIIEDPFKPIFVAIDNDEVCGYLFSIHKNITNDNHLQSVKSLYIDDLCVDENKRAHHIGSSLYNEALKYARENDFYNITLNVWAFNKQAIEFYEHLGLDFQKMTMEKIIK